MGRDKTRDSTMLLGFMLAAATLLSRASASDSCSHAIVKNKVNQQNKLLVCLKSGSVSSLVGGIVSRAQLSLLLRHEQERLSMRG